MNVEGEQGGHQKNWRHFFPDKIAERKHSVARFFATPPCSRDVRRPWFARVRRRKTLKSSCPECRLHAQISESHERQFENVNAATIRRTDRCVRDGKSLKTHLGILKECRPPALPLSPTLARTTPPSSPSLTPCTRKAVAVDSWVARTASTPRPPCLPPCARRRRRPSCPRRRSWVAACSRGPRSGGSARRSWRPTCGRSKTSPSLPGVRARTSLVIGGRINHQHADILMFRAWCRNWENHTSAAVCMRNTSENRLVHEFNPPGTT